MSNDFLTMPAPSLLATELLKCSMETFCRDGDPNYHDEGCPMRLRDVVDIAVQRCIKEIEQGGGSIGEVSSVGAFDLVERLRALLKPTEPYIGDDGEWHDGR